MRHRKTGKILDRKKAPREALLRGLATSVILYEKVRTTEAKAKAVRPIVERLITVSKGGTVTDRRRLSSRTYGENAVRKLIEEVGPRYKNRQGGYTRITKLGQRQGDGAVMVQLELV
ncbi:50S ribosomal protein L17 [Candidatus Uhrbacteria bacterium]|nr:50S ribosomal protein L17 [Candidatus Uhrbacteria bacterium]